MNKNLLRYDHPCAVAQHRRSFLSVLVQNICKDCQQIGNFQEVIRGPVLGVQCHARMPVEMKTAGQAKL